MALVSAFAHIPVSFLAAAPGYGLFLAPSTDLVPAFMCFKSNPCANLCLRPSLHLSAVCMDFVLVILVVTVPPGAPESAVSLPSHT